CRRRSVNRAATGADGRMLLHSTTEAIAPLASDRLLNEAKIHVEANLAPLPEQPNLATLQPLKAGPLEASLSFKNTVTKNAAATTKTIPAKGKGKAPTSAKSVAAPLPSVTATLVLSTKLRDAVAEGIGRLPDFDVDLNA